NIASEQSWLDRSRTISGWSETPWRVASSSMEAQNLSVPQLREYLQFNSDFPDTQLAPYRTHLNYRWALPIECLIVILIAAPLGIVLSRRGVLAGVATAIFLYAAMLFARLLFIALGKGDRIPPVAAAWLADAVFGSIGML